MKQGVGSSMAMGILGWTLAIVTLALGGCAVKAGHPEASPAPPIAASVSALVNEGDAAFRAGELSKASEKYQAALQGAGSLRDSPGTVASLFGLARVADASGEFDQALTTYQNALELLRQGRWAGGPITEADILVLKGKIYRLLSQYDQAVEHLRTATTRYHDGNNAPGEAEVLTQLAEISFWVSDGQAAVLYYRQALALYETMGNVSKQAEILASLGEVSWLSNDRSNSVKYFSRARALLDSSAKSIGIDPQAVLIQARRNNKPTQEEIKEFVEKLRPSVDAAYLPAAALLYSSIAGSARIYEEWQRTGPSLGRDFLNANAALHQKLGRVALENGDAEAAADLLIVAVAYHTSLPPSRDLVAECARDWYFLAEANRRQRNFDLALNFFRAAELLASALRSPELHWIDAGLARTYADMGEAEAAKQHYKLGLRQLESIQGQLGVEEFKIGAFEGALYAYRGLVRLLLAEYQATGDRRALFEGFEYHERQRARVLLEILGRSRARRFGGEVRWLAAGEEEIRRQVARIHQQLRAPKLDPGEEGHLLDQFEGLRANWRTLQREAAQQSPRYAQLISPHPVTLEEVQSVLDPDAVLLEYSTAPDGTMLWAITKDEVQTYILPGREGLPTLEAYLKTLREPLMGSDEVSQHVVLGQQIYRGLVEPATQQLRGKRHVIIVPDGPLYYLPFEALILPDPQDGAGKPESLAGVPYLVKHFRVSYAPSASVLVAQRRDRGTRGPTARSPLVAFGDPVYREGAFAEGPEVPSTGTLHAQLRGMRLRRLKFSGDEVRRIAEIWGVPLNSPHINVRDRASVSRVRELDLSQYRMLHFAAHAVAGDEVGWATQPALILSQERGKDDGSGLLQFADILELKLNADLVVLSACDTGLGRLREGEGIVGLTRAFLYAGASAVVASLWEVEDQSTSVLMEQFYRRLKQGESKAEALRQAKLDVLQAMIDLRALGTRQSLAPPFYWAPFILVGDWD
jgi:CHAT domain-containing protein